MSAALELTKAFSAFFGSGCASSSSPTPSPRSTTERSTSLCPRQARLQPLRRPFDKQVSKSVRRVRRARILALVYLSGAPLVPNRS